uniref:uncharacterized protein LOC120335922 n=1 Tax=Styela clava TaxID=7725 RepID=UPI00193A7B25|nr:uncharacterized protein LOC120335921 isoform X1 [Styela clava]XP_039259480.1 uncharacterized protein LOC120335922 [Styela clava]
MANQNTKGKTIGVMVSNGGNLKWRREGNSRIEVGATSGNDSHGIIIDSGGKAEITEKNNTYMEVRNLEQTPQGQNGASRNQEPAEATGITVGNESELVMIREDNATISVVANGEGLAKGIDVNNGTADITERGNARIQVGSDQHMTQYQNKVSGAQQEDTSVLQQRVYITVRNYEKQVTEPKQVNLTDKVQKLLDEYGGVEYSIYCGERKLDANETFSNNKVKKDDVLTVGKEVIVTSNNGQPRDIKK